MKLRRFASVGAAKLYWRSPRDRRLGRVTRPARPYGELPSWRRHHPPKTSLKLSARASPRAADLVYLFRFVWKDLAT